MLKSWIVIFFPTIEVLLAHEAGDIVRTGSNRRVKKSRGGKLWYSVRVEHLPLMIDPSARDLPTS